MNLIDAINRFLKREINVNRLTPLNVRQFLFRSSLFFLVALLPGLSLFAQIQPPTFTNCTDIEVCSYGTKDDLVHADIQAEVVNHCATNPGLYWTTHIDLHSDGSIDQTSTKSDASGEYPLGVHIVTFWAADGCGGVSSCERVVTVKDCVSPVAICKDKFVELMPSSGMVVAPAKDLLGLGVSDNISPVADLQVLMERMSDVSEFQTMPDADAMPMIPVTCDDFPPITNCNITEFKIWVGDKEGNWSSCSASIEVEDWGGACAYDVSLPWLIFIDVWNNKITDGGAMVLDISRFCSESEVDTIQFSNEAEWLVWYAYDIDKVYQVYKHDDPSNGVDVLDLYLLKSLILKKADPTLSFQAEAGDVNRDCTLSIADYLLLRKHILTNFAGVDSTAGWRFIPIKVLEETGMPDLCAPQEAYKILDLLNNGPTYIGYKLGDLNHDHLVDPFTDADTRNVLETTIVRLADQHFYFGQEIIVPLHLPSELAVSAFQLELEIDEDKLSFVDLQNAGTGELTWERLTPSGHIRILWVRESEGDVPQFKLILEVKKVGQLSSSIQISKSNFQALAYSLAGEKRNLDLVWSVEEGSELAIRPVKSGQTGASLCFWVDAPKSGEHTVTLFDFAGRELYNGQFDITAGGQQIDLPFVHVPPGMVVCRITSGNHSTSCSTIIQE